MVLMASGREARRAAYVLNAQTQFVSLAQRGVYMSGNAAASVVLLKGELTAADTTLLLSGPDGAALRAALEQLGYAPQAWGGLASCTVEGTPLCPKLLREALCAFDPDTIIACDEAAAQVLREAYADELAALPDISHAMLDRGVVTMLLGMRVLNLGGFEAALLDKTSKLKMWHALKQLPALGEPF
ncbi:hypothetical protein [Atopobium fossor]|uniref:hypothetical protein n=1 Tax=Atopobium fossor TaxID=39487 RepID=UPI0004016E71|nr:hypothetical protein [Atopobium fossor]